MACPFSHRVVSTDRARCLRFSNRLYVKNPANLFENKLKIEVTLNGIGDLDGNQGVTTFSNDLTLLSYDESMTGNGLIALK